MLKRALSYGSLEGISKVLNKAVIFVLPLIISPLFFGKVGLIVAAESLLPIFSLLGLDRALIRFYHEKEKYDKLAYTAFTTITVFQLLIFLIFGILYATGIKDLFGLDLFPQVFLLLANTYLLNLNQVFLNIQRVQENHKIYFKNRIIFQFLKFSLVIILSFYFRNDIGYLMGAFIALMAITLYHLKLYRTEFKLSVSRSTLIYLLLFCWPFMFHAIAGSLLGNIDRFILEKYISLPDLGVYTLAYSIGSSVSFALIGISIYFEPLIYKSRNSAEREVRLRYYTTISVLASAILFILLLTASYFLIPNYFSKHYRDTLLYIPVIALGSLFSPYYFQANYRLVADNKPLSIAQISVLVAAFNIAMNFILIPHYGIQAAAVTTFLSLFLISFILLLRSNAWKWKFETTELTTIFLPTSLVIFINNIYIYSLYGMLLCMYMTYSFLKMRQQVKETVSITVLS